MGVLDYKWDSRVAIHLAVFSSIYKIIKFKNKI